MINARYGLALTPDDVTKLGEQILRDERSFNRDAGFTTAHDRLPDFFQEKIEAAPGQLRLHRRRNRPGPGRLLTLRP